MVGWVNGDDRSRAGLQKRDAWCAVAVVVGIVEHLGWQWEALSSGMESDGMCDALWQI